MINKCGKSFVTSIEVKVMIIFKVFDKAFEVVTGYAFQFLLFFVKYAKGLNERR